MCFFFVKLAKCPWCCYWFCMKIKSTTWQAKQLGAYYILLQTCNQLEEHFFGIEVAGCRSNLVCANVWSYCPSRRSKMNLLRLHHKHQRLFCGLERALRLDARRIPSSADVPQGVTFPFFLCNFLCNAESRSQGPFMVSALWTDQISRTCGLSF